MFVSTIICTTKRSLGEYHKSYRISAILCLVKDRVTRQIYACGDDACLSDFRFASRNSNLPSFGFIPVLAQAAHDNHSRRNYFRRSFFFFFIRNRYRLDESQITVYFQIYYVHCSFAVNNFIRVYIRKYYSCVRVRNHYLAHLPT